MSAPQIAIIALGALSGGFVSGLAGFGTGLTAIGIWLYVVSPTVASSLVIICSVVAQLQTLPAIWRSIEPKRVLPFIVPGVLGVPLGTLLLGHLDTHVLKIGVGGLLLVFPACMFLGGTYRQLLWGGRVADGAIGFGSGVLGGLAGLSGVLPTMWATLRGWPKGESRGLFQAFNLTILGIALLVHAGAGLLTREVGWAVAAALPGTVCGAWLGVRAYARLSDRRFRGIILVLLSISGGLLIWSNI